MRLIWGFATLAGLSACCGPDACGPALTGFAALAPVTTAINAHMAQTGQMPQTLAQMPTGALVPDPAGRHGLGFVDDRGVWHEVGLTQTGDGLSLTFSYSGPGMNHCVWTYSRQDWRCSGYH